MSEHAQIAPDCQHCYHCHRVMCSCTVGDLLVEFSCHFQSGFGSSHCDLGLKGKDTGYVERHQTGQGHEFIIEANAHCH